MLISRDSVGILAKMRKEPINDFEPACRQPMNAWKVTIGVINHIPELQTTHYAYLISCYFHLSKLDEVNQQVNMLLELEPTFTISQFERTLHYQDEEDRCHLTEALRASHIPD